MFPIRHRNLTYPFQRMWHACPALRPERGLLDQVPLGRSPSLPSLRSLLQGFVREVRRYYRTVRLPMFVHHRREPSGFPTRPVRPSTQANMGSPGSRARCFSACMGSLTARGSAASCDIDATNVAFRLLQRRRHPGVSLSRLNTQPAPAPVNASTMPSRTWPHDSRTSRVANSSTYDSFIHYTLPV
jgi:hypothetical protein